MSLEDLGRSTWLLLHTMAAHYPDSPSKAQRQDVKDLIGILARLYPCAECARHFAHIIAHRPPAVSTGHAFREWLCAVHNEVNASLDKPQFDCTVVHTRWGGLGCSDDSNGCLHSHSVQTKDTRSPDGKRLGV